MALAAQPPTVTIRMMKKGDLENAARFISKTMTWSRETYAR